MRSTPRKNQTMVTADEGQAIEASGDAIIIADAIHDLAAAIREHAHAVMGDEPEEGPQYDLSGNPL